MNFKINSIVIPSILAFALIAGIIPAVFAQNNTGMTSEGGNMKVNLLTKMAMMMKRMAMMVMNMAMTIQITVKTIKIKENRTRRF
jgi:hypothetical protein